MVSLDPHDFNLPFRIRELADVRKELPVIACQPAEVKVRKNVAQQDKPSISSRFQNIQCFPGTAYPRPEVDVRQDDGVENLVRHATILVQRY